MAKGKFSQPRNTAQEAFEKPIPKPVPKQAKPEPIKPPPAAPLDATQQWQEKTQVLPDNWQDATQVITGDWQAKTQNAPEAWREATQVVPQKPAQPQNPAPQNVYRGESYQPTEEWNFEPKPAPAPQPRPVVRNHLVENYDEPDDYDYGYEDEEDESRSRNKKIIIASICALVLVGLFGTIWAVTSLFGGKEKVPEDDGLILNHVIAAGIDLGGMTQEEAENAIYRATRDTYSEKSMVITMPDTILELSPKDTGAYLDIKALVETAFSYGRSGNKSDDQRARDKAARGEEHIIALLPYLTLDEAYIQDALAEYGESFNSSYESASYTFEGTKPELEGSLYDEKAPCQTLLIHVGQPGRYVDVKDVYEQVLDAYSFHTFQLRIEESQPEELPQLIDLDKIFKEYCSDPIDAYMDMQSFEVVPETYGYTFDLEKAKQQLEVAEFGTTLEIPMTYVAPEILGEDLEEMLLRDTLGSYESKTNSDANRNTNIKLACQAINGKILNPGDSFSFNDVVGKRTEAAGYKTANAFFDGEVVEEVGGGICQVSSTLYCAVLLADLDVTARRAHSSPVSYVPMGMDATVSWGGPEFKFRNDTKYPIRIDASVSGGKVIVKIIGTDDRDYTVKVEAKTVKTIEPETKYEEFEYNNAEGYLDGDVIQEGTTGYSVKTYKYRYDKKSGELIGESVESTSEYQSKEEIIAKVEPEPTTIPTTEVPTTAPTTVPTEAPTTAPTEAPTTAPTAAPTTTPTQAPATEAPPAPITEPPATETPTTPPTAAPTEVPATAPAA